MRFLISKFLLLLGTAANASKKGSTPIFFLSDGSLTRFIAFFFNLIILIPPVFLCLYTLLVISKRYKKHKCCSKQIEHYEIDIIREKAESTNVFFKFIGLKRVRNNNYQPRRERRQRTSSKQERRLQEQHLFYENMIPMHHETVEPKIQLPIKNVHLCQMDPNSALTFIHWANPLRPINPQYGSVFSFGPERHYYQRTRKHYEMKNQSFG